jgi:hypothetical protein
MAKKLTPQELEFQQYLRDLESNKDIGLAQKQTRNPKEFRRDIDKIIAHAANTPLITDEDLIRKAREMKYTPRDLLTKAVGSLRLDKSSANLSQPLEDVLNQVDESQRTNVPGNRYIVDPNSNNRGYVTKNVLEDLGDGAGVAVGKKAKGKRFSPEFMAILDAKNEMDMLDTLGVASHEEKHLSDFMTRPEHRPVGNSFQDGHHQKKGIFEGHELIREAKDLPKDSRELEEITKQTKKMGGKIKPWTKLMSVLGHVGPIGAGIGALSALHSGDVPAAVLHGASAIDPTGIADAALDINNRLKMSPEEAAKASKEDFYSAMPGDLANEYRVQDQLDAIEPKPKPNRFNKIKELTK